MTNTVFVTQMSFVPRDLITIQVGRLSDNVYPKIEPGMPSFEQAHAFQLIKSTLEPLPIDTRQILDTIGIQLNCSAIIDRLMFDWKNAFDTCWFGFANLAILSFHDSSGAIIANTTTAGNPSMLLPIINRNLVNCHQGDVHFIRVNCTVNFASLILLPNYGALILCVVFYIKLPQTTRVMTNGAGANYNLTTWHGVSDFATLTQEQVRADILEPCLHDGPVTLRVADFNLNEVQIDDTSINETIQAKILKLGFKQICASVLQQLCPGYSNQPHAAIEHIRQSAPGPDGQLVTATTIVYYQRMLNAARPFATQHTYAINVCNKFIQGLNACTLGPFRHFYPGYSTVHDLRGAYQHAQLPIILPAAQAAEDEVKQMQDIAHGMLGQGFYSNVIGGGDAPTFASQAEKTLSNYKGGKD
jgi:hypothetical protein